MWVLQVICRGIGLGGRGTRWEGRNVSEWVKRTKWQKEGESEGNRGGKERRGK